MFSRHELPAGSQPACAAGRCCSPYPLHYRTAFAFSSILYPLPQQRALRRRLPPKRRNNGLTLFRLNDTNDLVPAFTPAAFVSVYSILPVEHPAACLLARACQRLWLLGRYDACGGSLSLDISFSLAPPTALTLAVAENRLAGFSLSKTEARCLDSFRPSRYQPRRCR